MTSTQSQFFSEDCTHAAKASPWTKVTPTKNARRQRLGRLWTSVSGGATVLDEVELVGSPVLD